VTLSKDEYLGHIASGYLDYRVWEPDVIAVRVQGRMALLRYHAHLDIVVAGHDVVGPLRRYWHTDSYEQRDGRWQVVWSQADRNTAAITGVTLTDLTSMGLPIALKDKAGNRPRQQRMRRIVYITICLGHVR